MRRRLALVGDEVFCDYPLAAGADAATSVLEESQALTMIQSYEMEQAEKELNEFYKLTLNDEEGHENKAWVLYELGDLNRRLERHDQSAAFFESALQTEMMIHGKLGLDSVGTLDSLAHTLVDEGSYAQAELRHEQLAALLDSVADQKGKYFRLNVANVHQDLANLYIKEAREANKESFPDLPENDPQILKVPQGVRDKARAEYRKAVSIWERCLQKILNCWRRDTWRVRSSCARVLAQRTPRIAKSPPNG